MTKDEQRKYLTERYQTHIGVGDGWLDIVQSALYLVEPYIVKVNQIKEKFGGLRIYVVPKGDKNEAGEHYLVEKVQNLITVAEWRAESICEITGNPGTTRNVNGWLKTLSDEEYEKRMNK